MSEKDTAQKNSSESKPLSDSSSISNGMEKIVSLAKRRGFIFQGSEIYGGLAGTWDYGPLGVALKNKVKQSWWDMFVEEPHEFQMYGLDAAILMNEKVWEASGHTGAGFSDPMVECAGCKRRFREDHLEDTSACPECGGVLGDARDFNLMFETHVGAQGDMKSYLRPETAQGIFVNFKNVLDTMRPKLPFGIAQIGKAFRNEIAPRDFVFRTREFEQMEIEFFVREDEWETYFEKWSELMFGWFSRIGLDTIQNVRKKEVSGDDLAHYSKRTVDFEYDFPGKGFDELAGLAYRTDHDLKSHQEASGERLTYTPVEGEPFIPHVIEPTFGVDRAIMAILSEAYTEDEMGGETRTYLKLSSDLAPYRVMVSPLLKNKPELVEKAREVFVMLKKVLGNVAWDDNGNIGKRYRRQDEIGTPYCVTIDFDTLGDENPEHKDTVTVRNRDTGKQERVAITELLSKVAS